MTITYLALTPGQHVPLHPLLPRESCAHCGTVVARFTDLDLVRTRLLEVRDATEHVCAERSR